MKKVFCFLFILFVSVSVLSAQVLSGWWTGGNLEIGMYQTENDSERNTACLLSLDLPWLTLMHNPSGLFLSFSPYHIDNFLADDSEAVTQAVFQSFVNMKFGVDLLKNNTQWDITPYVALNWNPFDRDMPVPFETGCDVTLFMKEKEDKAFPFRVKVATLNAGCRFQEGKPYFVTGISVDVVAFVYSCLMSEYNGYAEGRD